MAFVLGKDSKAYRNTGTFGTPVWTEIPEVADLKDSSQAHKTAGRRRASGIFAQYAITEIDVAISFGIFWDLASTNFVALRTAFYAGTEQDMVILDGSITSGAHQGLRLSAAFTKFEDDQGLQSFDKVEVEIVPGMTFVPLTFTGS
jgi:hypothetical protein